jgi:hypothetical protein
MTFLRIQCRRYEFDSVVLASAIRTPPIVKYTLGGNKTFIVCAASPLFAILERLYMRAEVPIFVCSRNEVMSCVFTHQECQLLLQIISFEMFFTVIRVF